MRLEMLLLRNTKQLMSLHNVIGIPDFNTTGHGKVTPDLFCSSLPPVVEGPMSYLCYLCLFSILVSNTYCVVFWWVFSALLPVSLDCPFLIATSVFSIVYLLNQPLPLHSYSFSQRNNNTK